MFVAQLQLPIILVAQLQLLDHHTCGTWLFTISVCLLCRSACVGVIHLVLRHEGVAVPWYFPHLCNSTTVGCFAGHSASWGCGGPLIPPLLCNSTTVGCFASHSVLWGCGGPLIPPCLCVTLPLEVVLQNILHCDGVVVHRYLPICVTTTVGCFAGHSASWGCGGPLLLSVLESCSGCGSAGTGQGGQSALWIIDGRLVSS